MDIEESRILGVLNLVSVDGEAPFSEIATDFQSKRDWSLVPIFFISCLPTSQSLIPTFQQNSLMCLW